MLARENLSQRTQRTQRRKGLISSISVSFVPTFGSWPCLRVKSLLILVILIFFMGINSLPAQSGPGVSVLYQQGRSFMMAENWYSAVETFLECLRLNPAHAGATAALAECYYELAEFDQALVWVRRARALASGAIAAAFWMMASMSAKLRWLWEWLCEWDGVV